MYKKDREHFKITGDWNKQLKRLKVNFPKQHLEVINILKIEQNYRTKINPMARKFRRRTFQVGSNLPAPFHYN